MALIEGCKHKLEITVPLEEVEAETARVIAEVAKKAQIPGFRPGKAPASILRTRFAADIRQDVLEKLVPAHFKKQVERDNLKVVGTPDITDVHFHAGEPLRFTAQFEVASEFELKEYRDLPVAYKEPALSDDDVAQRLEQLRDNKADYVNIDPRPVEDGDYAVVALKSISGVDGPPVDQEDLMLHIGAEQTLPAFSENLRGVTPGEEREFDVAYPEDYGSEKLAGKTVRFKARVKVIRRKELPELNDDFAQDLGDFKNLDELRESVRKTIFLEREYAAQHEAKNKLIDKLVEMHDFPVPEAFVDRQLEIQAEQYLAALSARGADVSKIRLDWSKMKATLGDRARHDVKASLILDRIAEREAIEATVDEVDREIQRIAKQEREPIPAVRRRLEKDGSLRRIANHFRTEKVLNFLFERARKVAE